MSTIRLVNASEIFAECENIKFLYSDNNLCPICSCTSNELTAKGYYSQQSNFTHFYVLKACPHCGKISLYKASVNNSSLTENDGVYNLKHCIFTTQSELAEKNGYDKICGMGYRKAIEFLIKDYLCKIYPESSETIKKEMLSQSINRITENRIKVLASRCAWLGNDETHYTKKHGKYDIETLKIFINSVVHYIDAELAFISALEIQPK